jgi:hypothetical protein
MVLTGRGRANAEHNDIQHNNKKTDTHDNSTQHKVAQQNDQLSYAESHLCQESCFILLC